jgi:hypothetical protein
MFSGGAATKPLSESDSRHPTERWTDIWSFQLCIGLFHDDDDDDTSHVSTVYICALIYTFQNLYETEPW